MSWPAQQVFAAQARRLGESECKLIGTHRPLRLCFVTPRNCDVFQSGEYSWLLLSVLAPFKPRASGVASCAPCASATALSA